MFQPMTEAPKRVCPKCKGRLRRLIGTGAGMIFKGTGFYITDYRSKGYKDAAKKESGAATATKTETKSEPKNASKTSKPIAEGKKS